MATEEDSVRILARDIGCGEPLARDLLQLAGGDEDLVREASKNGLRIESVKNYIIDVRFKRVDTTLREGGFDVVKL